MVLTTSMEETLEACQPNSSKAHLVTMAPSIQPNVCQDTADLSACNACRAHSSQTTPTAFVRNVRTNQPTPSTTRPETPLPSALTNAPNLA